MQSGHSGEELARPGIRDRGELERLLIYCQDSLGLGHLRRNVHIAHAVARLAPAAEIVFIADSPLAPFFELPANCDFVKLPTLVKVRKGDWEAPRLPGFDGDELLRIRTQLIRDVADSFQPDVMLVDHMPHGARGELKPTLASLGALARPCQRVLGLRDILGAPEDIVPQWRGLGAYELLERHYERILVYGSEDLFDATRAYQFPESVATRIEYVGFVTAEDDVAPRQTPFPPDPEAGRPHSVLVMGGGGHDAHAFMDVVVEAVRYLGNELSFNTYVITGPFMSTDERRALERKAANLPIALRRFREDTAQLMGGVDAVIAMAGYNTTVESLRFARSAILVPRAGPSLEQTMRTRILHERGLIHEIHPDDLTPARLARAIEAQLARPRGSVTGRVALDGAARAARQLVALAGAQRA